MLTVVMCCVTGVIVGIAGDDHRLRRAPPMATRGASPRKMSRGSVSVFLVCVRVRCRAVLCAVSVKTRREKLSLGSDDHVGWVGPAGVGWQRL